MPTPSSDGPSGPPSPGFSTCPEDHQNPSRSEWDAGAADREDRTSDTDMEERDGSPASMAVEEPPGRGGSSGSGAEQIIIVEERTTVEPSSRATTMSPRPQSSITAGTSPASTASDTDAKIAEASVSTNHDLHRAATNQSRAARDSSTRRSSPEQRRNVFSRDDSSGMSSDDELYAPSMGSDYPSMRVRTRQMLAYGIYVTSANMNSDEACRPLVFPSSGQQISRHPAIREAGLRCSGGDQACRYAGVVPLRLFAYTRYVPPVCLLCELISV